jgi:hypothetical protein
MDLKLLKTIDYGLELYVGNLTSPAQWRRASDKVVVSSSFETGGVDGTRTRDLPRDRRTF